MISAIILAAGRSKRMGTPKMLLPWKNTNVLGQVISIFQQAGIEDILVVTGGAKEAVEKIVLQFRARSVYNTEYATGEMLSSLQCGLRDLEKKDVAAALIGLGDQPQVQAGSVRRVCETFIESKSNIVVPSYQKRRGHPWLVARPLWNELLGMNPLQTPRDFLNSHANEIHYVDTEDSGILADLDTPEDYQMSRS